MSCGPAGDHATEPGLKLIGNKQASWAAGHLIFSPAWACYQQLYSIALNDPRQGCKGEGGGGEHLLLNIAQQYREHGDEAGTLVAVVGDMLTLCSRQVSLHIACMMYF